MIPAFCSVEARQAAVIMLQEEHKMTFKSVLRAGAFAVGMIVATGAFAGEELIGTLQDLNPGFSCGKATVALDGGGFRVVAVQHGDVTFPADAVTDIWTSLTHWEGAHVHVFTTGTNCNCTSDNTGGSAPAKVLHVTKGP
jgi:hypothetical protein